MDYSQFLYMKEELSLVAVILIIFLADLFMNPDKRNNMNNARFATILPIVLMVIHTIINLVPAAGSAEAFGGMYQYAPMQTIIKAVLNIGTIIVFFMAAEWLKLEDTSIKRGEFYIMTLSTLLGMYLMISAGHFLMFFIGLGSIGCFRQISSSLCRSRSQIHTDSFILKRLAAVRPVHDLR